jgi:hypothetical protein
MDNDRPCTREEAFAKFGAYTDEAGNTYWPDGRVNHAGRCFNETINGCAGRYSGIGPYCPKCDKDYDDECDRERRRDKFDQLCSLYEGMDLLPPKFHNWPTPRLEPWQAAALSGIKSDYSRNVWLHAEKGHGKTWTAWTLLQGALWHGIPVAYIDCSGSGLGEVCRNHNARKAAAVVKVLVLDDVSRMYVTEYAAGELHNLLSDRGTAHLRTLVFDQQDGKYFKRLLQEKTDGRFGASTVERLSWKGAPVIPIEMKGRNLRME